MESSFSQINPQKLEKYLKVKNSAKNEILKNEIIDFISNDLKKIPNYLNLKNDIEIIRHICNIIENLIDNNKEKIDKKQLVIDVLCQTFSITKEDEKKALANQIQFLFDNKFIKKISTLKILKKRFFSLTKF